jgi:hypothetical protein
MDRMHSSSRSDTMKVGGSMLMSTPMELRENARSARQIASEKLDPHLKRLWASYALALAQLAEEIERTNLDSISSSCGSPID